MASAYSITPDGTVPQIVISRLAIDSIWIVTAATLVFFMQAGFALLESGLVRSKNAVNVMLKNYLDMCIGALAFWAVGYGLMFGANPSGWIGSNYFFLNSANERDYLYFLFQMLFAATAATVASGAMAERVRYGGYLFSSLMVTALIYPIFGSWAWGSLHNGQGWLREMGFIDFAGSTVVHSIGGWVALAGIWILGPRIGRFDLMGVARPVPGHNLVLVGFGGFILWFGWFGFNGGSTLEATPRIGLIVLNTHLSGAAGVVGVLILQWAARQPILLTQLINGGLGGLVAITAGCNTTTPDFAILTGFIASMVVFYGVFLLEKLRFDDAVGAVAVHGLGGVWGTLAAGLFYADDLFNPERIGVQLIGIVAAFLWAFPTAFVTYWCVDRWVGLRADTLSQQRGLDFAEHAEQGYPEFQESIHRGRGT